MRRMSDASIRTGPYRNIVCIRGDSAAIRVRTSRKRPETVIGNTVRENGRVLILAATPSAILVMRHPDCVKCSVNANIIVAEDTRTTKHLLNALGSTTNAKLIALHDHNEVAKADDIVRLAHDGDVVMVSDAGMPGISDPGYVVARTAHEQGVTVSVIPGPSAAIARSQPRDCRPTVSHSKDLCLEGLGKYFASTRTRASHAHLLRIAPSPS